MLKTRKEKKTQIGKKLWSLFSMGALKLKAKLLPKESIKMKAIFSSIWRSNYILFTLCKQKNGQDILQNTATHIRERVSFSHNFKDTKHLVFKLCTTKNRYFSDTQVLSIPDFHKGLTQHNCCLTMHSYSLLKYSP